MGKNCKLYECKWTCTIVKKQCYLQGQVGRNPWRLQAHFLLHGFNRKQHRVLGFYSTREDEFECVSTIQKSDVQIDRLVHGVCPMLHPLHLCDLMALYDNVFGFLVLQLDVKSEKNVFLGFLISSYKQKALMEFSTPPTLAKGNPNT